MTTFRRLLRLTGLVAILVIQGGTQPKQGDSIPSSDQQLMRLYQQFNTERFDSQLPTTNVYIDWDTGTGTYITHYEDEPVIIRINIGSYLQGHYKAVAMDILHEMAHLSVEMKHPGQVEHPNTTPGESDGAQADKEDGEFQKEMLRLANAGVFKDYW